MSETPLGIFHLSESQEESRTDSADSMRAMFRNADGMKRAGRIWLILGAAPIHSTDIIQNSGAAHQVPNTDQGLACTHFPRPCMAKSVSNAMRTKAM
jgi:hypothetical protein